MINNWKSDRKVTNFNQLAYLRFVAFLLINDPLASLKGIPYQRQNLEFLYVKQQKIRLLDTLPSDFFTFLSSEFNSEEVYNVRVLFYFVSNKNKLYLPSTSGMHNIQRAFCCVELCIFTYERWNCVYLKIIFFSVKFIFSDETRALYNVTTGW